MKTLKRFLLALILVTILFEILLRVFVTTPSIHIYDAELGFRYQPNARLFLGSEGFAENTLNSLGLNDSEMTEKQKNRMLIIGDSYTEARQVDRKINFTSIAEQLMPSWDIVNAGRDGLHIVSAPIVAKRLNEKVKPGLIVLSINNGDFRSDLLSKEIIKISNAQGDEVLRVKPSANDQIKQNLSVVVKNSALAVQLIRQFKGTILSFYKKINKGVFFSMPKGEQKKVKQWTDERLNAVRLKRLKIIIKELEAIAPVALLFIHQVDFLPNKRAKAAKTPSISAAVLSQFSKENGLIFENTAPNLIKHYGQTGKPGFGFHNSSISKGHLNALGHKAVAQNLSMIIKRYEAGLKK